MAFFYRDGQLKVGTLESNGLDIVSIASRSSGPVYIYDLDNIELRFNALNESLASFRHTIHYAMKANSHSEVLKKLERLGAGVDTVSGGEIRRALDAGFTPDKIIFSGVAKTKAEIELALSLGIKQINVESPQELERIREIAERTNKQANVAFRLNPDVNPQTHPYITTGFRENKFGMDESFLPELMEILKAAGPDRLRLRGLTMHIGSQLFDLEVFREAIGKTVAVHRKFEAAGFSLDRLDIGGGLGIHYDQADEREELESMKAYGRMAAEALKGLNVELLTEPGRVLVARSGLLVGEVQYVKRSPGKTFVILDTGMHHLIRPALYGARHRVLPLSEKSGRKETYDIVGPICESSDFLAKSVELPEVAPGDRIAIADAGAYGAAMASRYNSHELPEEIAVERGRIIESMRHS